MVVSIQRLIIANFNDPEKQNHIHETAEQQCCNKSEMASGNAAENQILLNRP